MAHISASTPTLIVSSLGYAILRRRGTTFLGETVDFPKSSGVNRRLLAGATLFGIGWGLAGFCPGPALAATVTGALPVLVFVASMGLGTAACRFSR